MYGRLGLRKRFIYIFSCSIILNIILKIRRRLRLILWNAFCLSSISISESDSISQLRCCCCFTPRLWLKTAPRPSHTHPLPPSAAYHSWYANALSKTEQKQQLRSETKRKQQFVICNASIVAVVAAVIVVYLLIFPGTISMRKQQQQQTRETTSRTNDKSLSRLLKTQTHNVKMTKARIELRLSTVSHSPLLMFRPGLPLPPTSLPYSNG